MIVQDLENNLSLKEHLLQKYIAAVNDKDKQINQLFQLNSANKHEIVFLNFYCEITNIFLIKI